MGLVRITDSPRSSSIRRRTPCVDGCWGPMLMIMVSSSGPADCSSWAASASDRRRTAPSSRNRSVALVTERLLISWAPSRVSAAPGVGGCAILVIGDTSCAAGSARRGGVLELHGDAAGVIVLAERVPDPVLGQEDAGQVRMAREADAEHIEHLALGGLGARVDLEERGRHRIVLGHLGAHPHAGPLPVRQEVVDELEPL